MSANLSQDLQYAIELARGAGKIVSEQYGKVGRLTKTHAATTDEAVTDADRASQRYIVAGLHRRFPADGIIGEESETVGTGSSTPSTEPIISSQDWARLPSASVCSMRASRCWGWCTM